MPGLIACNATLEVFSSGEMASLARSGELAHLSWEEWWPLRSSSRSDPALQPGFEERVRAVASAGYTGIGINNTVYKYDADRLTADATFLAVQGLEVAAIETPGLWFVDREEVLAAARVKEEELYAMAAAFGCRRALANTFAPDQPSFSFEAAIERFAALCDRAAQRDVVIGLEFVIGTLVSTVEEAAELVRRAGRPNSGIIFDAFSFFRGGGNLDRLRSIPPEQILAVQLSDGASEPSMPTYQEAMRRRLRPGAGAFDLVSLVRTLDSMGVEADYEVEVFADQYRGLPVEEAAKKAYEATIQVLNEARS